MTKFADNKPFLNVGGKYQKWLKRLIKWVLIIVFSIGALVLNITIIDKIIMPDPCYYHTRKMNFVLALFYSSNGATGYHPEINFFNLFFTIVLGGFIGYKIHHYLENKNCY